MNRQTFCIGPDDPCLDGHFPDAPIVPGVVLLDRVIEAVQSDGITFVIGIRRCKFAAGLYPGEICTIEWHTAADSARFVCRGATGVLVQGMLALTRPDLAHG